MPMEVTSAAPPRKELPPVKEKVAAFRQEVVQKLRSGEPLYLPMETRNGGDLLIRAACWEVISLLCTEEGIDPSRIQITALENEGTNLHEKAMALFSIGAATGEADRQLGRSGTLYQKSLYQFAFSLGVEVPPELWNQAPQIRPTDKGPLRNYDEGAVEHYAQQLRQEIGNKQVVVIGQAGSSADKRFNDPQLVRIAEVVRSKHPDAYIVVLSDKSFLRHQIERGSLEVAGITFAGFPIAERVSPTEKYSSDHVAQFRHEMESPLTPGDGNTIDRIAEPTDINELLAYMRVAEEGVFTDSYWMHLAASQDISKLISLFTLFHKEEWAPPESIAIEADALDGQRSDHISSQFYHQSGAYEGRQGSYYGIEDADIEKFSQVVAAV